MAHMARLSTSATRLFTPLLGISLVVTVCCSAPHNLSGGLQNLGNTCYLNAQLQCAYHIPRVQNLVIEGPPPSRPAPNTDETDSQEESNEGESVTDGGETSKPIPELTPPSIALQALRHVFRDMKGSTGPVSPRILTQSLGINAYEQQDSQEFWKLLLPALKLSPLTDLYQGAYQDYLKALDGSGREKKREETFLDLALDVSEQHRSVLSSLKETFGKPELLSVAEGNGWRPAPKADKVDAHKGSLLSVQGLPAILQLQLKRFHFDWNTETTHKLNHPIHFDAELDLSKLCQEEDTVDGAVYDLQAVVLHMGEFNSGHYYAYVRPDVRKDQWFRFNDDIVTEVDFEDVLADACGGATKGPTETGGSLLARIRRAFQGHSYGFGGSTSNAYVLQYVKRVDIPFLFDIESS